MRPSCLIRILLVWLAAGLIARAQAAGEPLTSATLPIPRIMGSPTFSTEKITALEVQPGPAGCVLRYALNGRAPDRKAPAYYHSIRLVAPFTLTMAWFTSQGLHGSFLKLNGGDTQGTTLTLREKPVCAVNIDPSEDPSLAPTLEKMQAACEAFFPRAVVMLDANSPALCRQVLFKVRKDYRGVAATAGSQVWFAPDYYHRHPDDIGSAIHEMVHIVQDYHGRNPGWLVEGVADAVRWWHWEPAAKRPRIDAAKHKYTDSYQVTGSFLAWIEAKKDPEILTRLNTALHGNTYRPEFFEKWTGKDLDGLWLEYGNVQKAGGKARKAAASQ